MTTLLADDESSILRLAAAILESDGHTVMCARDGAQALEISRRFRGHIDLLVSDVQMPNLNGIDLCRLIHNERPEITIVLTSGCIPHGYRIPEQAHFVSKPFTAGDLL